MRTDARPLGQLTALGEPTRLVDRRWLLAIMLANLGAFMALFTSRQLLLPAQIERIDPVGKIVALGWITTLGGLAALVAQPLAGALSDRTICRFGRRRPWILAGVVLGAAALTLIAYQNSVLGVLLGWCLAQAAFNTMFAGLAATLPDQVPVSQRAMVSGLAGIGIVAGLALGGWLVTHVVTVELAAYMLLAVFAVVLALPFVMGTSDPVLAAVQRSPFRWRVFLTGFWVSPRRHPDFAWAWITRFLMMLANSMLVLYLLYFLDDVVRYEQVFSGGTAAEGLVILTMIYTTCLILTAVGGGIISDRLQRRRLLVSASSMVVAVAALLLALWPVWAGAVAAATVLGAGFGVYIAASQALITQVLPSAGDRARDLGTIGIASAGAGVFAPALAVPLVTFLGGFTTLYLVAAGSAVLGGVLIWKIRSVP